MSYAEERVSPCAEKIGIADSGFDATQSRFMAAKAHASPESVIDRADCSAIVFRRMM